MGRSGQFLVPLALLLAGSFLCGGDELEPKSDESGTPSKRVKRNEEEAHYDVFGNLIDPAIFALENFYSFHVRSVDGRMVDLLDFKGKVSLVVNVATDDEVSASMYAFLNRLQDIWGPTGFFNVLAFPCNQFGAAEPMSNEEIDRWTREVFKVTFPVFAKINVTFKEDQTEAEHPPEPFAYLSGRKVEPYNNFCMFLVDHMGDVLEFMPPDSKENALMPVVMEAVEAAKAWSLKRTHGGEL